MVREALTAETLSALEPRDAAARFIARRAEGLTSNEQQLLADWLAQDEVHRRMFDSADRGWHSLDDAQGDEILAAMRAHALAPRRRSWARWQPAAAAAVLLLLTAGAALFFLPPSSPSGETIMYASARGEVKEFRLPDGSAMTLDADSAAIGRFSANSRSVVLQQGRAFFAVAPDKSRPFSVAAAGRRVVAVGTRFDVNLTTDGLTVTLLDGEVNIESLDPAQMPVTLKPGQQYVDRLGKATIQSIGAASENAISWRQGLINFVDQPLIEAAAVMNRYSLDQITISDPGVASLRVSGQFRAGDTQRFAETLAEIHRLRTVRDANRIELIRKE